MLQILFYTLKLIDCDRSVVVDSQKGSDAEENGPARALTTREGLATRIESNQPFVQPIV